jgi:hypothetical protein
LPAHAGIPILGLFGLYFTKPGYYDAMQQIIFRRNRMKSNATRLSATTAVNPYAVWSRLADQTAEMLTASAQVIGHRSARMAMAGPLPSQRDQQEFSLMGQEKMEALSESAHAVTIRMIGLHQQVAKFALRQIMDGATDLLALAAGTSLQPNAPGQPKLVNKHITNSTEAMSQLNASLADVAQTGLQPLHSRATANAKRLEKL